MAAQLLHGPVVGQGDAAVRAASDVSAERALQGSRVAAPVQKQDDLLFTLQAAADRIPQDLREDRDAFAAASFPAHIHHPDERHLLIVGAAF
jgi:hypothetical protein